MYTCALHGSYAKLNRIVRSIKLKKCLVFSFYLFMHEQSLFIRFGEVSLLSLVETVDLARSL